MDPLSIPWILIENAIFWALITYIVIFQKQSPSVVFTVLGLYTLYVGLRFMFSKQGMEFGVLWYSLNAIILMIVLYGTL